MVTIHLSLVMCLLGSTPTDTLKEERARALIGITPESAASKLDVRRQPVTRHPLFTAREDLLLVDALANESGRPEAVAAPLPRAWVHPSKFDKAEQKKKLWDARPPVDALLRTIEQANALGGGLGGKASGGGADPQLDPERWTPVGRGIYDPVSNAHRTGRARCAAYAYDASQDMTTLFVGGCGGGLWKFNWGRVEWEPVSDSLVGSPSVGAFAIDPNNPARMIIGSGDGWRYQGTGIYLSTTSGQTWSRRSTSPIPDSCSRVLFDRSNGNVVLVSTNKGIYRSVDAGLSWTRIYSRETSDLRQDPVYHRYWYAGAPGVGILESSDGGRTFHPISGNGGRGLPDPVGRVSVTVCDAAPNYVYALVEGTFGSLNNVYRSRNYGYDWTPIDTIDGISWGQAMHTCAIEVDPRDPDVLLVGMAGFQRTVNATANRVSWVRAKQPGHADYTSFTFIPEEWAFGNTWVLVTNDGGYCTYDYSTEKFYTDGNLLGLNLGQVMTVPHGLGSSRLDPTLLLSGTQDNGVVKIDTNAQHKVEFLYGGDGGQVNISSNNTGDYFASIGGPPFSRYMNVRSGSVRNIDCQLSPSNTPVIMHDPVARSPLMFTHDQSGYVYYDSELGFSCPWNKVNSSAIPFGPKYIDLANDWRNLIFWVAGTNGSVVVMDTSVHGRLGSMSWEDRTPPLPSGSQRKDCSLAADRFANRSNAAYYVTADSRPFRCYMTETRGLSWIDCTGNLGNLGAYFWELVALPRNPNTLFLATSVGIFRSLDRGRYWKPYMDGLPAVIDVRGIEISHVGKTPILRIATNGRGWFERVAE